jgi:hypothetical protein
MGNIPFNFPASLSLSTNSIGQLYFDNFLPYLGCDTSNSDLAFTISMHPPFADSNGRIRSKDKILENLSWDFRIIHSSIEEILELEVFGSEEKYNLSIYNNLGQILITKSISLGLFSCDFSRFENGLYFAVLNKQGHNITRKFIKL